MLGGGPSSRLSPRAFQGSVVSVSKASAVRSERIGVVPVAVESVPCWNVWSHPVSCRVGRHDEFSVS